MLITFMCPAYQNVTMFGDVGQTLLKIMGHSGMVPSAISANEVPEALARLEAAVENERTKPYQTYTQSGEDNYDVGVSLIHRALPLIELLRAAEKEKTHVMWKKA